MPSGTGYFHKLLSYFYIFSPAGFFCYRIFLLLSGKQYGHSCHISHKALFSKRQKNRTYSLFPYALSHISFLIFNSPLESQITTSLKCQLSFISFCQHSILFSIYRKLHLIATFHIKSNTIRGTGDSMIPVSS